MAYKVNGRRHATMEQAKAAAQKIFERTGNIVAIEAASQSHVLFHVGDRVQLHPGTDRWMMGDRYGEVVGHITRGPRMGRIRVKLDRSGRTIAFHSRDLTDLDGNTR